MALFLRKDIAGPKTEPQIFMNPIDKPWVNLAVFESESTARMLETHLQRHGFEARTANNHWLRLLLFLHPPHATHRVQVRHNNFVAARRFLKTDPAAGRLVQEALQCPECGSLSVQYPQMTRKSFTPTILLDLRVLFRITGHEACCEHCHCLWHLSDARPVGEIETAPVAEKP